MGSLAVVSLIALLVAIVIGFVRNVNVGILSMGFALVLGLVYGVTAKEIIAGFSGSLFIQMVGVTYLFAILQKNGSLELMAKKVVRLTGKHAHLIPFVMFIIGFLLSASGPGSIPCLAIIPVIAIPVALSAGINPIMTAIIGDLGVMSGRMSPITPEAAVVRELMEEQGLDGNTVPIMLGMTVTCLVIMAVVYIYYKGWKVDESVRGELEELPKLTTIQILSLIGLLILVIGVLFFGFNCGLAGFLIGSIILIIGGDSEKEAIKAIPWGVILMVLGVGILMNVISLSGGIDLMVTGLQAIMTKGTAELVMSIVAGVMSFFSSGLGVVFPTLVPTASGIGSAVGVDPVAIVTVIVIGGTVAGFTPISTTGALIMAGVSQQENAEEKFPQNRMFVELFVVSFVALAILAVLCLTGIYSVF